MNNPAASQRVLFWAFLICAPLAFAPDAEARNIFKQFSTAPTFTPPAGCIPVEQTYGVPSRCEKGIEPGRTFVALIDTAMGAGTTIQIFVDDHVDEIKDYWEQAYPGNKVSFSSRISDILPTNTPSHKAECREYSITVEIGKATDQQPVSRVQRVEGLTCAWNVENPEPGAPTIELFWLEAYDDYAPPLGQKPMVSFDQIVRDLFASAQL
jgi:hypothetical protein